MDLHGVKVFVGLSGGVDSAVSAALLKGQGAEVTGVFIKGWYPDGMPCTWAQDRRDAMRVAAHLEIPFRTLDASEEYKTAVIDYLVAEYRAGRTPNPDVMCNREVKFGVFYRYAREQGADAIATGHYVTGEKDQRYFLWAVPREVLERTIFPVGHLDKKTVRAQATKLGLPVATKRDSQGVCFLGAVSVKEFLARELRTTNPAILHTLGERVEGKYVVAKDVARGEVTLADSVEPFSGRVRFGSANWHGAAEDVYEAELRYHGPRITGAVSGRYFTPSGPIVESVTPGQSIVFYAADGKLVGGGMIEE